MAANPSDFMDLGASGGPNPYLASVQGQQGLQQGQQQLQIGEMQIAAARSAQAQAQQYQADVAHYFNNPKPEILASLIAKYPQQAQALKDSKAALDEPAWQSQLTSYGQIYNAANAGRADLLIKQAQGIKAAEAEKGVDTSEIDDLIGQLGSSDPAAVKAAINNAKALSQVHIAALDPKFADDLQKLNTGANHFTSTGDSAIYDQRTGEIIRQAPDKPAKVEYRTVKNADGSESIVQLGGGGDQASGATGGVPGSTSNAPRRSMGWTPRARDGGDNSDAVVDSKLVSISKATGIGIDDPLTPAQLGTVIAAIPATEGGAGSIADRNNNPGNIKWGGFARSQGATKDPNSGYAVFPTKAAGLQAAQRLGQGYYARGQRTIRDIIEGKPVGGGVAPAQASGNSQVVYTSQGAGQSQVGDTSQTGAAYLATIPAPMQARVVAIAEGRSAPPRNGTKAGDTLMEAVTNYDPTFDAANATSRVKTRVDFTSGKSAQAVNALNTAMGHLLHLDDQAHDLGNFSTAPGMINPLYNLVREKVGGNTALPAFDQTKQAAASEMRKVFAGASGGSEAELQAWESQLSSSKSYEQLHAVIKNGVTLMGSRLSALQDQYATGMNRSDQIPQMIKPSIARAAKQRFGVDLGATPAAPGAPQAAPGFKILRVRPK